MTCIDDVRLIQCGMGVHVSNWRLARAVAGEQPGRTAGTVSGTCARHRLRAAAATVRPWRTCPPGAVRAGRTIRDEDRCSSAGALLRRRGQGRRLVCDLGVLQQWGVTNPTDGSARTLMQRCPSAPVGSYVHRRGPERGTDQRRCLCNGLLACVGLGQVHERDGTVTEEPAIITLGDHLDGARRVSRQGRARTGRGPSWRTSWARQKASARGHEGLGASVAGRNPCLQRSSARVPGLQGHLNHADSPDRREQGESGDGVPLEPGTWGAGLRRRLNRGTMQNSLNLHRS